MHTKQWIFWINSAFFFRAKEVAKESFANWPELGQAGMLLASVGVHLQHDMLRTMVRLGAK